MERRTETEQKEITTKTTTRGMDGIRGYGLRGMVATTFRSLRFQPIAFAIVVTVNVDKYSAVGIVTSEVDGVED